MAGIWAGQALQQQPDILVLDTVEVRIVLYDVIPAFAQLLYHLLNRPG